MVRNILAIIAATALLAGVGRAESRMKNTKLESDMAAVNGTRLYYEVQGEGRPMLKDNLTTWMAPTATQWPSPIAYQRLEKIGVPTLIIVGDKDTSAILDCDEYMARKIPGARKIVIPDTAHHLNMEKPAEFNRIVLDFLSRR